MADPDDTRLSDGPTMQLLASSVPARVKTTSEPKFADSPLEEPRFEPSVPLRNHDGFGELPETVKLVAGKVPKGRCDEGELFPPQ